jgi:hypothetical protein
VAESENITETEATMGITTNVVDKRPPLSDNVSFTEQVRELSEQFLDCPR